MYMTWLKQPNYFNSGSYIVYSASYIVIVIVNSSY